MMLPQLTPDSRVYFRDELRRARTAGLDDAEGFQGVVFAIERLGAYLQPGGNGLGSYREELRAIAGAAPSHGSAQRFASLIAEFDALFENVRHGRNEALHTGSFARHLSAHCTCLALLLEDGLMAHAVTLADLMIREPVCVAGWQPVAFARHLMLQHSFSFLPIHYSGVWHLLSDYAIASYAAPFRGDDKARRQAMAVSLEEAIHDSRVHIMPSVMLPPESSIAVCVSQSKGLPVLAAWPNGGLAGIATPFDLL